MIGKLMVAMTWSFIFIVAVFAFSVGLQFSSGSFKTLLRGEFTAVGIAVGLSWEHLFDTSLEGIAESVDEGLYAKVWMACFTFLLAAIVFPAWVVYILPRH